MKLLEETLRLFGNKERSTTPLAPTTTASPLQKKVLTLRDVWIRGPHLTWPTEISDARFAVVSKGISWARAGAVDNGRPPSAGDIRADRPNVTAAISGYPPKDNSTVS